MKTNCWLILGTMLATTAVAQVNTNKLPEIPPPANTAPGAPVPVMTPTETQSSAPAKKTVKAKKKTVRKARAAAKPAEKKAPEALVMLVAGPATVAAGHVNLRGQAGMKGEVVGHLEKGDAVTVIAEINLDKPKTGEPAQWAKIALPSSVKVWINNKYVEPSNNVVSVKKLNLRGGPGENYSVLGVVEKGTVITAVANKGDWTQIEAPASSFAFVAASYLKQDASLANVPPPATTASTEAVPPPAMPPTPTTVTEAQPIAPPAATPPPTETTAPATPPAPPEPVPAPTPVTTATMLPEPTLAPDDTNLPPPPPRVVTHEGSVRHSVSPVAPTDFELYDQANNKAINYLYSTTTNLVLSRYNGLHITVTGEEGLDARWKDTPVLTIQKIYVLSPEKPVTEKPVKKHWWSK
jgi:uncharacterized protein YgiM (DUF1202 family)